VILLDRDDVPSEDLPRKGTLHTLHSHGLLARGPEILEQLFPGITASWIERGGMLCDVHAQIPFYAGGVPFARAASDMRCIVVILDAARGFPVAACLARRLHFTHVLQSDVHHS
jgi:hypothetical protein